MQTVEDDADTGSSYRALRGITSESANRPSLDGTSNAFDTLTWLDAEQLPTWTRRGKLIAVRDKKTDPCYIAHRTEDSGADVLAQQNELPSAPAPPTGYVLPPHPGWPDMEQGYWHPPFPGCWLGGPFLAPHGAWAMASRLPATAPGVWAGPDAAPGAWAAANTAKYQRGKNRGATTNYQLTAPGSAVPAAGAAGRRGRAPARGGMPEVSTPGLSTKQCKVWAALLEEGDAARVRVMAELKGRVWDAAQDPSGCRVVQGVIAIAKGSAEQQALAEELHGHVLDAADSPHANFVIQKVIEVFPASRATFVVEECSGNAAQVARHRYGCRILCRLLEHMSKENTETTKLINEVLEEASTLCGHSYGHHVIRSIMEHGNHAQRAHIAATLHADILKMAQSRNASHIVEGAFDHCSEEDRMALVTTLCRPENIVSMAQDQFGSFVVRVLIKLQGSTQQAVLSILEQNEDRFQGRHAMKLMEELRPLLGAKGKAQPEGTLPGSCTVREGANSTSNAFVPATAETGLINKIADEGLALVSLHSVIVEDY